MTELQSPSGKNSTIQSETCKDTLAIISKLPPEHQANALSAVAGILSQCAQPPKTCTVKSSQGDKSGINFNGNIGANGSTSLGVTFGVGGNADNHTTITVTGGECPSASPSIPSYDSPYSKPTYGGGGKYGGVGGEKDRFPNKSSGLGDEAEVTPNKPSSASEIGSPLPTPPTPAQPEKSVGYITK